MIFDIEIDGELYQCKRLSAMDAFEIGHLLGTHNLIFLASKPDNAYALMAGLMGISFTDAKKIATTVTKGACKVVGEGEKPIPVNMMTFSDDITLFYRLAAELIIANFQQLSSYLLEESDRAEAKAKKKKGD